jgi:hypothetical protein
MPQEKVKLVQKSVNFNGEEVMTKAIVRSDNGDAYCVLFEHLAKGETTPTIFSGFWQKSLCEDLGEIEVDSETIAPFLTSWTQGHPCLPAPEPPPPPPKFTPLKPEKTASFLSALRIRHNTPYGHLHVTIAVDIKAGRELEIFAQIGKSGAPTAAELEGICRLASLHLRSGGSLEAIIKQLSGIGSVLDGLLGEGDKDGSSTSVPDSLARALRKYVKARDKHGLKSLILGEADMETA